MREVREYPGLVSQTLILSGKARIAKVSCNRAGPTVLRRARVPEDQIATQLGHLSRPASVRPGVYGERIFLKVDKDTRANFEAEGCGPLAYKSKNAEGVLTSY